MISVSQPNTSSTSYDLRRRRLVTSIAYRIVTIINSCPQILKDKLYTHSLSGLMIYMKRFLLKIIQITVIWSIVLFAHMCSFLYYEHTIAN